MIFTPAYSDGEELHDVAARLQDGGT